jgi:DNA polymerase III epsilon subunit-like protein
VGIYAADIETTGLLEQMQKQANPKLHNFCAIDIDTPHTILFEGHQRSDLQEFLSQGHTLVMHNGKLFDMEALKLLGYDVSRVNLIDTLALSWYLEPNRIKHGLAEYGEEFGVPKPAIEDWENQTQEEYNHRVQEDCKIQKKLWQRQVAKLNVLYGTGPDAHKKIIAYLMQKMEEFRQQQQNRWKLDVEGAIALQAELEKAIEEKTEALRQVMPKVPEYVVRKRPSAPFKKNGDLSEAGKRWKEVTEQAGLPFEHKDDIKVVKEWKIGNPASHTQIKAWLDSLGWEPITFKFVRGENGEPDRNIPQINLKGGEVCQSVKDLIPKCAGIEHIAGLGILNHRVSVVKGFLRDHIDGEVTARMQGFTNTLRVQHRECVNLPSLRVKYGKELRGLLMARPGKRLLGSDLSSLEDRLKHHFQWKLDPEYVKSQMTKGFDAHNRIAVIAGLMTQDEADFYAWYKENH